jgi:hypothetical protein
MDITVDEALKVLRCNENLGSEACKECVCGKSESLCLCTDGDIAVLIEKLQDENKQLKASQPTKCSECKHLVTLKNFNSECGLHGVAVSMGDYCSCGERREENNGTQNTEGI